MLLIEISLFLVDNETYHRSNKKSETSILFKKLFIYLIFFGFFTLEYNIWIYENSVYD